MSRLSTRARKALAVLAAMLPSRLRIPKDDAVNDQSGVLTVFYDGACPLCTAEILVYRKCADVKDVAFVDVSGNGSRWVAPGIDKVTALKRFHVRAADGTIVSGAEAFGRLWLALPTWRWLGRIVLLPGVLQATEAIYRGFLVFRPVVQWIFRTKLTARTRL